MANVTSSSENSRVNLRKYCHHIDLDRYSVYCVNNNKCVKVYVCTHGRATTPSYTHSHWQYLVRRSFFWVGKEDEPEFNRHVKCVTLGLPASHCANNVLTRGRRQTETKRETERVWLTPLRIAGLGVETDSTPHELHSQLPSQLVDRAQRSTWRCHLEMAKLH